MRLLLASSWLGFAVAFLTPFHATAQIDGAKHVIVLGCDGMGSLAFKGTNTPNLAKLMQRERLGSTGVGHGVALPHARLKGLDRMHGVFVRLESPIDFQSVDEQPVDLIFALLAPLDHPAEHLRTLAKVSRVMRQSDLRQQLRKAHGVDAIRALMVQDLRGAAA